MNENARSVNNAVNKHNRTELRRLFDGAFILPDGDAGAVSLVVFPREFQTKAREFREDDRPEGEPFVTQKPAKIYYHLAPFSRELCADR